MQKTEQQTAENKVNVSQEFFNIQDFSRYVGIKTGTIYAMVEAGSIPHYRIGRLIRFKRSEIDIWMEGNKKDCVAPEEMARRILGPAQKPKINIDRIVRKAIDGTRGQGYTKPHGKPDQVKGLGKEVPDGTV